MPRQSVEQLQVNLAVRRGDAGFWSIIRELDPKGPWGWRDVDQLSNAHERGVRDYIKRLELAGFVSRVVQGETGLNARATKYRLVKNPVDAPRIDRNGQIYPESKTQRLWRSMRMAKSFTAQELTKLASDDDVSVSLNRARAFISALVNVGVVRPSGAGTGRIYVLVRDLGPIAPAISIAKLVFDRNSRSVIGQPVLEADDGQQ